MIISILSGTIDNSSFFQNRVHSVRDKMGVPTLTRQILQWSACQISFIHKSLLADTSNEGSFSAFYHVMFRVTLKILWRILVTT